VIHPLFDYLLSDNERLIVLYIRHEPVEVAEVDFTTRWHRDWFYRIADNRDIYLYLADVFLTVLTNHFRYLPTL